MQLKAVTHGTDGGPKHPLLILAGAGSGKTRVITTKIAHLIAEKRAEPESILAVTFTNKAAEEMRQRAAALAPGASAVLIRTFHSFGAWLLRRNAKTAGLDRSFVIYDEDDSVALLKAMTEGAGRKGGGLETGGARSANARFKRLSFLISRAKDYALSPEDDLSAITPDPEFPALYRQYQDRLSGTGNADFGDLIFGALKLLRNEAAVRKRICQRFSVVLVDEFQDSNVAQFELLKQLFDTGTYLCVVGDDDQSIYRFRGAEVKNIIGFSRHFPDTDIIRLEENYRSTPPILSLASGVVSNNRGRLGKTLWTGKTGGIKPVLVYLRDHREEAAFCAELLAGGNRGGTAILYRVNAQSREFEHCFSRNHIPYRLVGSVSFYSREEVKDT
ncbi:MAG: DNA/RNA helicase, partial [Spirochaetales bacterium]